MSLYFRPRTVSFVAIFFAEDILQTVELFMPNHQNQQSGSDFEKIYPSASRLNSDAISEKMDFESVKISASPKALTIMPTPLYV